MYCCAHKTATLTPIQHTVPPPSPGSYGPYETAWPCLWLLSSKQPSRVLVRENHVGNTRSMKRSAVQLYATNGALEYWREK